MISLIRKTLKTIPFKHSIVLGKIGPAYGILGWIRVLSYTENSENIFNYQPWIIHKRNEYHSIEIENWKKKSHNLLIKIKGINDRNQATLLKNFSIIIESEKLPVLEVGNYYWKDLIGCQVITPIGFRLGCVINMIETGANDVMVLKRNKQDRCNPQDRLVPFLYESVIKKVDLYAREIEADWDPDC